MYRIGIDVGSTYTKYCIRKENHMESLFMEKTPVRQKEYFDKKLYFYSKEYPESKIISCGYGKKNVSPFQTMNELTALARGSFFVTGNNGLVLDIGGQDTKIILQENGCLKRFFLNDKCAAGSGMFLTSTLDMLGVDFNEIDLSEIQNIPVKLNSTCAVFAQSEIVGMITDNHTEKEIVFAVLWQIFTKAKQLLDKVLEDRVMISGGLSQIKGIVRFAEQVLGRECFVAEDGAYLAAIGCTVKE